MTSQTRTPTATVTLNGQRWRDILSLGANQQFGEKIATGSVLGRNPPTTPQIGMSVSWAWGYDGDEGAGFTGEVSDTDNTSYPGRWALQVKDVLFRADKSKQVIVTDPLNEITARDAIIYILTHYGGIPASRLSIPALSASGSAWAGSEWVLGVLTPVQWGDVDTDSGGSSALDAAVEICSCLGFWLYADASGIIRAKQMERKPSTSAREVFQRGVNLLVSGAPERKQSYDSIYNQVSVRGGNTGVDGAQIVDQFRTTHPLLPAGVYRDKPFSSFLIEYVNESEAGTASATATAKRQLNVVSRIPDVETHRAKADKDRKVGDTVGLIDSAVGLSSQKNYFIYSISRTLDLQKGAFDDQLVLDGGTGSTGFTTIPPPDASFSWTLDAETLDGTAVVVVALDGSGSTSPTGEIVSYAWSTDATPYSGTADTATGVTALLVFPATPSPVNVTLVVTDTTSKTDEFTAPVDLTGADTHPPLQRVLSAAGGASWDVTLVGGATWLSETTNGDAVAVPPLGAGIDDRAADTAGTYGLLATRGTGGAGGLRQTLDGLASASTDLASASGAITCLWVNEANPARVWRGIGDTVERSIDGGATFTAMAKPNVGTNINWIIEDPAVENSVFVACGADLYNATDPTVGWALLFPGPVGATARQFVRSRDGQVTWICYVGTFTGGAAQRVETGAGADIAAAEIRTLALDKDASSLRATLTLIDADNPAAIYHVDGLTGLSAVTSAATFPADAIVQHMLADPQIGVYYTADFDSIAPGTGALRKLIADQLLLFKAGDTGVQYHMLGFGGRARAAATIIMLPFGESGAADNIFVMSQQTGLWSLVAPPEAGKQWTFVRVNPFNTAKWLLYRRNSAIDNENALWYTDDAGATWTNVFTNITQSLQFLSVIAWSATIGSEWAMLQHPSHVLRGSDATYTQLTMSVANNVATTPGVQGDILTLDGDVGDVGVFDVSNAFSTVGNVAVGAGPFFMPRNSYKAAQVVEAAESTVQIAQDYRTGPWSSIAGSDARFYLGVLANETLICGGAISPGGIQEISNAWGASPTPAIVAFAGMPIGAVATDAQSQTVAAAVAMPAGVGTPTSFYPVVRSADGVWSTLPRPPQAGALANMIEIVSTP